MAYKIVAACIFISMLLATRGQDVNTTNSPVDILRLKFELNNTRTPNLLVDLLSSMDYKKYTNETINLKDILNFMGTSNTNHTVLQSIFTQLKINSTTQFADKKIEEAFTMLNISVLETYLNFITKLNRTFPDVQIAFNAIGLDLINLNNVVLFNSNKSLAQIQFFNILEKGNYSEPNITLFLQSLNITSNEFSDVLIDTIGNKSMDDIFNLQSEVAIVIKLILKNLSLPPEIYENYEPFATILDGYISQKNTQVILATAYSSTNFITLDLPWAKDLDVLLSVIGKSNITNLTYAYYSNDFLSISSLGVNNSYLNISMNNSLPLQNCNVIIYNSNGQPIMVNATNLTKMEENFYTNLDVANIPNVASPLICNNTIYGLATTMYKNSSWQFKPLIRNSEATTTTMMTAASTTTESTTQSFGSTNPDNETVTATTPSNAGIIISSILNIAIISLVLFLL